MTSGSVDLPPPAPGSYPAHPSAESQAAVHDDRLPDDVVRHRRGQKESGAGHVGWSTESAARNPLECPTQTVGVLRCDLRHLRIDEARGNAVNADAIPSPGLAQRTRQAHRSCLRSVVGRIAPCRVKGCRRRDDDKGTACRLQHVMKLGTASHQAVEVDVEDSSKASRFEFAAAVEYETLCQNEHV